MSVIQPNEIGKCWRRLGREQLVQLGLTVSEFRTTLTAEDSAGSLSN